MTGQKLLDDEKLFYERFNALHADPVLLRIFDRFGITAFRRSAVLEGFASFLVKSGLRGKRVVEIGTLKGLTAIVLSRFFDDVVSIDIIDDSMKYAIADYVGVGNIQFVNVADNAEKASVIASMTFDAAFVDGNHARDTRTDFDLVRRCGRVLFHEHWDAQPPVVDLVRQLSASGRVLTEGKWALWIA